MSMIRTLHAGITYESAPINYIKYMSPITTNNWLMWLHGSGEGGALDGSQLTKVENAGPPKFAKESSQGVPNSFDYNFNVIAFQGRKIAGDDITNWSPMRAKLRKYLKVVLGADKIFGSGWSQGGMEIMRHGFLDEVTEKYLNGIVCCAGQTPSGSDIPKAVINGVSTTDWTKFRNIPVRFYHGKSDTSIGIVQSRKMKDGLLGAIPPRTTGDEFTFLREIDGGSHADAANKSWDMRTAFGAETQVLLNTIFDTVQIPDDVVEISIDKGFVIFKTLSGKIFKSPVIQA